MIQLANINITASDPSGQRRVGVDAPADSTIGELVDQLAGAMNLNRLDRAGKPLAIQARLERETRHLARSERASDALQPGDHLVLHPKIMAGAPRD